ncbi:Aspartate--tRNA ligase, mitochondrial [Candida viswanathii]|uniref:Aspartate--tRNA ligase, mitochondrial n=1 Tax=Candida viswanathii TaxID=5486 RepID=A0A367XSC6_9ASCO|nr:Aspartate--tRNA ligase, mitochondrial [Candida viswanathii]
MLKLLLPTIRYHGIRSYSKLPNKSTTLAKFDFPLATHTIKSISVNVDKYLNNEQNKITLNGHINRKSRIRPTLGFGFLRDANGDEIQLLATPESTNESIFELMKKLTVEDSVSVTGFLQQKQAKNDSDGSVELELVVEEFQILNSSNVDAARLDKLKHNSPADIPPQFRYLQLRTPYFQKSLRVRSEAAQLIREVFTKNHGFVEIETPLLFKSTPEGAREFLVPTRALNKFYALPQSPQQYKQILMSSGITRYFQIAKCFRDEDLRSDRQPEFTQIDLEMSFISNSDQVGVVVEDVIHNVWNKVGGKPTYKVNENGYLEEITHEEGSNTLQFNKLNYIDALTKYGIDKPDLRSSLSFTSLEDFFVAKENAEFPVVEVSVLKQAFEAGTPKKYRIPKSFTDDHNFPSRRPYVWAVNKPEDATNWYEKLIDANVIAPVSSFDEAKLQEVLDLQPGDIFAVSTRSKSPYENPTPLGKFRQLAIKEFPDKWQRPILKDGELVTRYDSNDVVVGSWVVNFPLFNPVETTPSASDAKEKYPQYDYSKFESTHHPFTMAKIEDYDLLESDPLKVRGEHYDLVINGVEVGGGSRRIHDPDLQQYIFEEILQISNFQDLFGHLLKALSMGCPPHAGLALGFDRLCAMLVGSSSIRDVIAFPKNQSGVDPVVESPTGVKNLTLNEYYITTKES